MQAAKAYNSVAILGPSQSGKSTLLHLYNLYSNSELDSEQNWINFDPEIYTTNELYGSDDFINDYSEIIEESIIKKLSKMVEMSNSQTILCLN